VQKDSDMINTQDNLFQLAFKKELMWSHVERILTMWKVGEVKGQKSKDLAKGKGKTKAVAVFESAPWWRT
jgi:hypothetical protein